MNAFENSDLTTLVPIAMDTDGMSAENIIADISEMNEKYGLTVFALSCPNKGWRSVGLPPIEEYRALAEKFLTIKNALAPRGIKCGWWIILTMKAGVDDKYTHMKRFDGVESAIGLCPLDKKFSEDFCERVSLFCDIARPAFIFTEDDFSVHAAAGSFGCFCEHHLAEFSRREGKSLTREEIYAALSPRSLESLPLLRRWRALMKDTIVGFASDIRSAVDRVAPEIPMGCCQPGAVDADGDATEDFARALAGPRHTPFSRLYGTFYCGGDTKDVPIQTYHALYTKQHVKEPFRFYHEADCFPHSRYFTSGAQMRALMATTMSYGFDGFLMQTQQLLDDPNEESHVFGKAFIKEEKRFTELAKITRKCRVRGVEISFDPFLFRASESKSNNSPLWASSLSLFGIPYTSEKSDVVFWDERMARFADDETVMRALSGKLFLDAVGARYLVRRGYGKYLGVDIGCDVAADSPLSFDLEAKEVITEKFARAGKGRRMPAAHMFAQGKNGFMPRITVTDPSVEVITELRDFREEFVSVGSCRYTNELGGTVVIMGISLDKNGSQSLLNLRRQRLIQDLILDAGADIALVKEEPCVFTIMNEPKSNTEPFLGELTLLSLNEDDIEDAALRLPTTWRGAKVKILDKRGIWQSADCTETEDGIILHHTLRYSDPTYLLFE